MIIISAPYLVAVVLIGTTLVKAMVRDAKVIIPLAKTRPLTIRNASNTENLLKSKIKKRNSPEMVTDDENYYNLFDETNSNEKGKYITPFSELVIKNLFEIETTTNTDSYSEETVTMKSEEPSGSTINRDETKSEEIKISQAIFPTDKTSATTTTAYSPAHTVTSDNTGVTDIPTPSPKTDSNDSPEDENETDNKKENNVGDSVAYPPTHTVTSDNTGVTDIPTPSPKTDSNDSSEDENETDNKKENNVGDSVAYLPTHTVTSDNTGVTDIPTPSPKTDSNDSSEDENETDNKKENNAGDPTFDFIMLTDPTTVTKTSVTTPKDGDVEETYSATTSMTTQGLDPRFCAKYKNGEDIKITDMTAMWRVVYYDTANTVACFKMIINKIYSKDKRRYYKKTLSFSDRIDWEHCHVEIIFGVSGRTHVLQKSLLERGVFKNIIFEEDRNGTVTLLEESLDQWMVFKDLLLLRDCNTGDIVVFARGSKLPTRLEISDALSRFGEDKMEGLWSCNDDHIILAQRIRKWITKTLL